jgi:indolepyruvate ferredoxin oxidoreductase beta subunit
MKKVTTASRSSGERIWNVYFCGTGGQGVLTAAEICAVAAMHAGHHVKKSEVHGMAQRGGSVESHVRFGPQIFSPLIRPKTADFVVCFHEGEGLRLNSYLKKGGISFVQFFKDPVFLRQDKRFLNTFFLGVLSSFTPLPEPSWHHALSRQLKRALPENLAAFGEGRLMGFAFANGKLGRD